MPQPPIAETRWASGLRGGREADKEARRLHDFTMLRPLLRSYSVQHRRRDTQQRARSPGPQPARAGRRVGRSRTQAPNRGGGASASQAITSARPLPSKPVAPAQLPQQSRPYLYPSPTLERVERVERAERGRSAERSSHHSVNAALSPPALPPPPAATPPADPLSIDQLWMSVSLREGEMRLSSTDTHLCQGCCGKVLAHWCTPEWVPKTRHRATHRKEAAHLTEKGRALLMEERGRRRSLSPASRYSPGSGAAIYDDNVAEQMYSIIARQAAMIEELNGEVGAVQDHTASLRAAADSFRVMNDALQRQVSGLQTDIERFRARQEPSPAPTGSPEPTHDSLRSAHSATRSGGSSPTLSSIPHSVSLAERAAHLEKVAATVPVDYDALSRGFGTLKGEAVLTERRLQETRRELAAFEEAKTELSRLSTARHEDVPQQRQPQQQEAEESEDAQPEAPRSPRCPTPHAGSDARDNGGHEPYTRWHPGGHPARHIHDDAVVEALRQPAVHAGGYGRSETEVSDTDTDLSPGGARAVSDVGTTEEATEAGTRDSSPSPDQHMLLRVDWVFELLDSKCRELTKTHAQMLQSMCDETAEAGLLLDQLELQDDGSVAREEWQAWFAALGEIGQSPDPILQFLLTKLRHLPRKGAQQSDVGRVQDEAPPLTPPFESAAPDAMQHMLVSPPSVHHLGTDSFVSHNMTLNTLDTTGGSA